MTCFKSMTWVIESKNSTPPGKVAVINLKVCICILYIQTTFVYLSLPLAVFNFFLTNLFLFNIKYLVGVGVGELGLRLKSYQRKKR